MSEEVPKVAIEIDGDHWDRWDSLQISMSLDEIAPQLVVSTLDSREFEEEIFPYSEGDEVRVTVKLPGTAEPERLMTGYLHRPEIDDDPRSGTTVKLVAFSKTVDLVECAVDPPKQWNKIDPLELAKELCKPFGIQAAAAYDMGSPLKKFETDPGETVARALGRIAEARRGIIQSDSFGNVIFTQAVDEANGKRLEAGQNIIRGTYVGDFSDRFSQYTVYSQRTPESNYSGAIASGQAVQVFDDGVSRFRPYAETSDKDDKIEDLEHRAKHARNIRAARSRDYSCDVLGWGWGPIGDSVLWRPNELVYVQHPKCQVDGLLLCSRVVLTAGAEFMTHLDFVRREAYDPAKSPKKPPKKTQRKRRGVREKPKAFWLTSIWWD